MQGFPSRRGGVAALVALILVAALVAVTFPVNAAPSTAPTEIDLELEEVATGFNKVTDIVNAGDDRLFIVEQDGRIKIQQNGVTLPTPFLDISSQVCVNYQSGLLGLVFHPDYARNGYFWVNYITPRTPGDCSTINTRISRFKVSNNNPNVADPASEQILLTIEQPFEDNNGGDLAFGPDGYLYIPLGDGGSTDDPFNNAQNLNSLLGKILRLSVSVNPTGPLYTIPNDNPFVGQANRRGEIWAYGLRNPWRISFDRLTGDLYIGDVGEREAEEINFQPASSAGGENYGWPCFEGTFVNAEAPTGANCGTLNDDVKPVFQVEHPSAVAMTGGFVYRGTQYPLMRGTYLFSDSGAGYIYSLKRNDQGIWQGTNLGTPQAGTAFATFGEDVDGELYIANYTFISDTIYHVVDAREQFWNLYLPQIRK